MAHVLLLTGTCGSGKSTIARALGGRAGWAHISEDEVWSASFGRNRGPLGSREYREKREAVQGIVFEAILRHVEAGLAVALDATVHEDPPDAYQAYVSFFEAQGIPWALRILHPALEVAVARDAGRTRRPMDPRRIAALRAKFNATVFPPEWFIDTSHDSPEDTLCRLTESGVA